MCDSGLNAAPSIEFGFLRSVLNTIKKKKNKTKHLNNERFIPLTKKLWRTLLTLLFRSQTHLLASTASDRSIILYDMRGSAPLRKVVMEMRSNTVAWNPLEAFVFTAANEDSNLYTFDIRRFKEPINVHMDHVSAVLDVDYSPTGQEFVSGSYDKTIRIFERDSGRSR